MNDYWQIQEKLKDSLPQLPKTLKKVASYMLESPGDVATLSMRKVASNINVAVPNFGRIAKILGYRTYAELREVYRKKVQQGDISDYRMRVENLQHSTKMRGVEKIWSGFRESALENINKVYETISIHEIAAVIEAMKSCDTIYVVGMQASSSFSFYLNYIGGMISKQFQSIGLSGGIIADDMTDIGEQDVLIAISLQPCARGTIEIAEIARERGCTVVGITDSPASPLALLSEYVLICANKSPLFFESYIATTAIIEILIGLFAVNQSSSAAERIDHIEADRIRLGEYWNNKGKMK